MLRFLLPLIALTVLISGCTGSGTGTPAQTSVPGLPIPAATTTSVAKAAPNYQRLLVRAEDLSDEEDTFHERSKESQPNGQPGATAFFVNDADTRAISVTALVYPDAETATATLKQASATLPSLVADGTPQPFPVGTGGTIVRGSYPDEDKDVTLVFFTQDKALVRLEFQSATGDATTDRYVTSVAKMQEIALRVGLGDNS